MSETVEVTATQSAIERKKINILFVSDGDSHRGVLRGEGAIKAFAHFYERIADITYYSTTSKKLANFTDSDLSDVNVVWLDNLADFAAARNLSNITDRLLESIEPDWRTKALNISKDSQEEAEKFIKDLNSRRADKVRIIYALDEFVWEAPVGRSREVSRVQVMESMMDIADTIVVPNVDLGDFIQHFKLCRPDANIEVVPSSIGADFFQVYRNFIRTGNAGGMRDKPRVLVKGLNIPDNVQEFIMDNHKKMDISICSVGEVNQHLLGLISRKKVSHIVHWAHPNVNRRTILDTMAIERDGAYDVVIHTKPEKMNGNVYELTSGDEDILFSIAAGSIPVCGTEHIGYQDNHLSNVSGFVFGPDTPAKYLRNIVESVCDVPVKFNEVYGKCRHAIENRISVSPGVMSRYYAVLTGTKATKVETTSEEETENDIQG